MTSMKTRELTGLEELIEWLDESPRRHRYEIIDGSVVVSPRPTGWHQDTLGLLLAQLRASCPAELVVFMEAGWAYTADLPHSYVVPDVAVFRRDQIDMGRGEHTATPLLAVDVRSASTCRLDEGLKKRIYLEGGVRAYWLVDPLEPRLTAFELRDGAYEQIAVVGAGAELTLERPFPMTLRLPG